MDVPKERQRDEGRKTSEKGNILLSHHSGLSYVIKCTKIHTWTYVIYIYVAT